MSDVEITAGDSFAPEEKAYFESRGETAPVIEEKAPEPEAQATPEPAPEAEHGETKDKTVPHGAFHEERQRRKQAEEKARALEIENAKAVARLEALLQNNQPAQQDAAPPPSPEDDIFGAVAHQGKTLEQVQAEIAAYKKHQAEEVQRHRILQASASAEQEFMAETPDYPDAVNHLRASRVAELQVFGYTEAQARQKVAHEELAFAANALQRNLNPAQLAYQWAQQRGYTKKAPEPPKEDPAKKLETLEAAQAANKSLSSTGGGASSGTLTASDLLAMSDQEFEAFRNSNPAKFRRIMAGAA